MHGFLLLSVGLARKHSFESGLVFVKPRLALSAAGRRQGRYEEPAVLRRLLKADGTAVPVSPPDFIRPARSTRPFPTGHSILVGAAPVAEMLSAHGGPSLPIRSRAATSSSRIC